MEQQQEQQQEQQEQQVHPEAGYQQPVTMYPGPQQPFQAGWYHPGYIAPPYFQQQLEPPQQQATQWPVFQQPVPWGPPQVFQRHVSGCLCFQCWQENFFPQPAPFFPQPGLNPQPAPCNPQPAFNPPPAAFNPDPSIPAFHPRGQGYFCASAQSPGAYTGPPSQPQAQAKAAPSRGPQRALPPPRRPRPDRHRGMDGNPLKDEDYGHRKVGKLCFYCGQDGHFVCDCPEEHRKQERKRWEWTVMYKTEPVEADLKVVAAAAKARYRAAAGVVDDEGGEVGGQGGSGPGDGGRKDSGHGGEIALDSAEEGWRGV